MNYKYIYILPLILITLFTTKIAAQFVNSNEAKKVATNFLAEHNIIPDQLKSEIIKIEDTYFHLSNFNNGYIIITDRMEAFPVIAWSSESNFDANNIPPEVNFWLKNYAQQLAQISAISSVTSKKNKLCWNRYLLGNRKISDPGETVSPLLNTYWNQGCYFNSALPIDSLGSCYHPYTGCVATALAQILKFYNYPKHGIDTLEISSPYGPLVANFQDTYYQWIDMENQVASENPAIAELMYHCVIAVKSQFLSGGTGAFDEDALEALVNYFDYSDEISFHYRDTYPGDWLQLMRDELDNERPIIYGGLEEETMAGHTFICDGYADSTFFHMNWGWGGQYNGFFYLDSLVAGNYTFDFLHDAIVGIRPNIEEGGTLYPPENLSTKVNSNVVSLTWDYPLANSYLELLGFNVYRDDSLLNNSIISNLYFDEPQPSAGNHNYAVQSVFIGNGNGPSTFAELHISGIPQANQLPFQISLSSDSRKLYLIPDGMFHIETLSLINTAGQVVFKAEINSIIQGRSSFDLPVFGSGIYLCQIKTDQQFFTKKLLVQ